MIIAGIDFSISCPAITVCNIDCGEFTFDNCNFYYLLADDSKSQKRIVDGKQINGQSICSDQYDSQESRFACISEWAMSILCHNNVTMVGMEDYAFAAKGRVFHIGEVTGLLQHYMWKDGIEFQKFAPATIKKFATGSGRAGKDLMYDSFLKETGLDIKKKCHQTETQENPSSDIIDSYYICKYLYTNILSV